MLKVLLVVVSSCIVSQAWSAEQIIATSSQASISQTQLIEHLKQQDYILLGEVHDEPLHHQRRASVIEALASLQPVVVAEQLEANQPVIYTGHLADDLSRAGYDAQVWDWTIYAPLFSVLETRKITLKGGNLPIAVVRNISRQGASAIPEALNEMIHHASLDTTGQTRLIADLEAGHCGHLSKQHVPNFILAQRARDASMLEAMMDTVHKPVILLAGNGHVRKDYGIPTLLASTDKAFVSIGFLQMDAVTPDELKVYNQQYDYVWLTGAVKRDDPCAAFKH